MKHDEEAGDDLLAAIDLHTWRVPPPSAVDHASLVTRVLSPARAAHPRWRWILAAFATANVALAAVIIVALRPQPQPQPTVRVLPAAGGSTDGQTEELLRRVAQEQRDLESRLADLQDLRTAVEQLSLRVTSCEAANKASATSNNQTPQLHYVAHDRDDSPPPAPPAPPTPPAESASCDEVSCVLTNFEGACCTKYRSSYETRPGKTATPVTPVTPSTATLPSSLDRDMIQTGVAAVKTAANACGDHSPAKGVVKVHVHVSGAGRVVSANVVSTPDTALGECVRSALEQATFQPTQIGGSFVIPFQF